MAATSKSFREQFNPAMQFISTPAAEAANPEPASPAESPAPQPLQRRSAAPQGFKPNPAYIETKSRRLQLLMQPSLHDKIKAAARAQGCSVNEYIHHILEAATEGE